jgi:hypothetical protein
VGELDTVGTLGLRVGACVGDRVWVGGGISVFVLPLAVTDIDPRVTDAVTVGGDRDADGVPIDAVGDPETEGDGVHDDVAPDCVTDIVAVGGDEGVAVAKDGVRDGVGAERDALDVRLAVGHVEEKVAVSFDWDGEADAVGQDTVTLTVVVDAMVSVGGRVNEVRQRSGASTDGGLHCVQGTVATSVTALLLHVQPQRPSAMGTAGGVVTAALQSLAKSHAVGSHASSTFGAAAGDVGTPLPSRVLQRWYTSLPEPPLDHVIELPPCRVAVLL